LMEERMMNERTQWLGGWMDGWIGGWIIKWMDSLSEWMEVWVNEWQITVLINDCADRLTKIIIFTNKHLRPVWS
jgi:hypothetical protein